MKKIMFLAITGLLIAFSGCQSSDGGNPKEVLTNFFKALSKKDVADAKKFATKDSEGMLDMMETGMKMSANANAQNDHEDKMMEMIQNVEMGEPVINGDKATINVKDKKSGENTDFVLHKEDGKWKVAFDMSTLMEMGQKSMKDHGMDMNSGNMDSMKHIMNKAMDSLNAAMPDMKDKMKHAQEMMDSAKKMMDKMDKSGK